MTILVMPMKFHPGIKVRVDMRDYGSIGDRYYTSYSFRCPLKLRTIELMVDTPLMPPVARYLCADLRWEKEAAELAKHGLDPHAMPFTEMVREGSRVA